MARPPIGIAPAPANTQLRQVGTSSSGGQAPAAHIETWYAKQRAAAAAAFSERSSMELRFNLTDCPLTVDQQGLLTAMRRSEVQTFGWPLGMISPNAANQPRIRADGIFAEIAYNNSFDYWALHSTGAFYIRQTLFEDTVNPQAIFFNTRIARVAEGIQLARNLYNELEAAPGSRVAFTVRHDGIRGRQLSATSNRHMRPFLRTIHEDEFSHTQEFQVPITDATIVSTTKSLLDPFFILFDLFKPSDELYNDIVLSFLRGQVT
jgi:hypothetical protein